MSLKALYEKFLARPAPELLSADASLNYITTTTKFTGAEGVVKHLRSQSGVVAKKAEKILSAVEGPNSLCLEVELTLEFLTGGGAYLLTLDENFLFDRVVTFPLVHVVQFDDENKISRIRLHWDQGSLLKQVEVIGSRNWPICGGKDQAHLISSAVAPEPVHKSSNGNNASGNGASVRSRTPSTGKTAAKDPHASLSLFESLSMDDSPSRPSTGASRGSAKPPPRDYNELFVGDDEPTPTKPSRSSVTSRGGVDHSSKASSVIEQEDSEKTPKKSNTKRFSHFEFGEDAPAPTPTPDTKSKSHTHFEFGEGPAPESPEKVRPPKNMVSSFEFGEEPPEPVPQSKKHTGHFSLGEEPVQEAPARPRSSKHMSQWDFGDFGAPQEQQPASKPPSRGQDIRHFGWEDDENEPLETPQKPHRTFQPRRDAETHFKIQDVQSPVPEEKRDANTRGRTNYKGLGLYENNLYDESGEPPAEISSAAHGASRKKDFDSHWSMADEPSPRAHAQTTEKKPLASDRMKAVEMMDSHWEMNDDEQERAREPAVPKRMSRDVNARSWGFGEDEL